MASRTVSVALVADIGQYQSAMVKAASSTKAVGTTAATTGDQAKRGFEAAGRGAALLGAVAAGGLVLGLKSAVSAASDAEQSIGGVEAVFKGYANSVIASSKEADRALGLSANSYRELATIIGSQMKNAGVPLDQLAEKTEGVVEIGADLAAQFGGSTQEAVEALSSAFRGELDPIERYGISLTAAAVGAKAVELGLSETETGLSQNAKLMATLAIVTEQSADAQGAFARESDTAAGRAQRAAAQWDNLKVAVGDRLLPAWSALVDVLGTKVIPFIGEVLDAGGDLVKFMMDNKEVALALAGVLAVQLAGGIGAVTVAFNSMILTPAVLGLSGLLGIVGNLPAAFAAARTAVAGFLTAAAPLVAVGAVVYAITKTIEFATAAGDARKEIASMWDAVDDARGGAQLEAMAGVIDQIQAKIRSLNDELPKTEGAFEGLLAPTGMLENGGAVQALDEYEAALIRAKEAQDLASASADVMSRRFGLTRDQVLDLAAKYDIDLTGSMSNTFRLMQNFYAQEFGSAPTEAVINLSEATEVAKTAFDDAKQAVDGFKLSLDILTGTHVSMLQVESALQSALADSKDAMDDLGGAVLQTNGQLNLQSANGREAADVLLGIRDAGNQWISTMIQQGATTEDVTKADADLRQSFINSATQMGISEDAAKALADQILGIPDERTTQINADTAAANAAIAATQRGIDNMHGRDITINVKAAGRFIVNPQGGLQEFADGGWTGPGSKYTPAGIVHADEFVVPKHRVNALGGPARVGSLVGMPGYADGGPVLPVNITQSTLSLEQTMAEVAQAMKDAIPREPPASSGGSSTGLLPIMAAARAYVQATYGINNIGGFANRNIAGTNVKSDHAMGKAIDIMTTNLPLGWQIANDFAFGAAHKQFKAENVIWQQSISSNGGRFVGMADRGSPTQNHRDHVHVDTYDQGGPLYPGYTLAYNGTGKTEWVSREMPGSSGGGSGGPVVVRLEGGRISGQVTFNPAGFLELVDARIDVNNADLAGDVHYGRG